MEHLESILKALSVTFATLAPFIKPLFGQRADRHRHLEDNYKRLKAFFDDGATARHAMLVEASFAAAVGHAKLSSQEIELLLRQRSPTRFMHRYMRCRDYLQPDEAGERFELRGAAARPKLRRVLIALGTVAYVLTAAPAFWTLAYVVAPMALQHGWLLTLGATAVCGMAAALGVTALIASGKLHHAAQLFEQQVQLGRVTMPVPVVETASVAALPLEVPALPSAVPLDLLADTKSV
jgi:hypothetical protein